MNERSKKKIAEGGNEKFYSNNNNIMSGPVNFCDAAIC